MVGNKIVKECAFLICLVPWKCLQRGRHSVPKWIGNLSRRSLPHSHHAVSKYMGTRYDVCIILEFLCSFGLWIFYPARQKTPKHINALCWSGKMDTEHNGSYERRVYCGFVNVTMIRDAR